MYCTNINPFISVKNASFTNFISTHYNCDIHNAETIKPTTELIENCHTPTLPTLYAQYSTHFKSSVITGIQYDPVSSEDQLHQPIKHTNV